MRIRTAALFSLCLAACALYTVEAVHAQAPSSFTNSGNTISTPVAPASGGTGTATVFTSGSVIFAGGSGIYSQDNANLFYDSSNHCLGVGTSTCSTYSSPLLVFRNTNGVIAAFQNTNAGDVLKLGVNNATGAIIMDVRNTADSANLPLILQNAGGATLIPSIKSTTGTRYVCVGTDGTLSSSTIPCSGT